MKKKHLNRHIRFLHLNEHTPNIGIPEIKIGIPPPDKVIQPSASDISCEKCSKVFKSTCEFIMHTTEHLNMERTTNTRRIIAKK